MKRSCHLLWAFAALGILILLAGCNTNRTNIGDINNNAERFVGKDVQIAGHVTQVWELPFGITNLAVYRVGDDTGQIWVISHDGAPNKGAKVGVKGTVRTIDQQNLPFLHNVLGDVIEEHQRRQI